MEIPKHLAIETFCHVIRRIPGEWAQFTVTVSGWVLGLHEEPTGLEDDGNRPVSHLYWDLSVDDVKGRMIELVEEGGLDEQMLVAGCLGCVDFRLYGYVDPASQEEASANRSRRLEEFRHMLTLPESERRPSMSDESLTKFIGFMEEADAKRNSTDEKVRDALEFFRSERDRLFTFEFWRMFEGLRLRDRE